MSNGRAPSPEANVIDKAVAKAALPFGSTRAMIARSDRVNPRRYSGKCDMEF
jgi:hypothetical protein